MSDRLPPDMENIQQTDVVRKRSTDAAMHYSIEFVYRGTHIADFVAKQPIREPRVGEIVKVHDVRVRVVEVEASYETDETGEVYVFLEVGVVPEKEI